MASIPNAPEEMQAIHIIHLDEERNVGLEIELTMFVAWESQGRSR